MTKNVTIAWELPTLRESGLPLDSEDISHVLPEMSADGGANYGPLAQVDVTDTQEIFAPELDPGNWYFRFTVVDTEGRNGAPWVEVVNVIDESPPGTIQNVTVTQT